MIFAVIVSKKDLAGMNINKSLIRLMAPKENGVFETNVKGKIVRVHTIDIDTINYENIENEIEAEYYIFATRHQSKSGEKTLSVHVPGNYSKADYGGQNNEFCTFPALLVKTAFKILNDKGKNTDYQVTLEATHHGPLVRKPVMFIEIGSSPQQWQDENAAGIIASTIFDTIKEYKSEPVKTALGFGGTHYCSNFNKIELSSDFALSHICPKYNIKHINTEQVKKMISATYEKVDCALLDWKGIQADDKPKLISIFDELNLNWKKTKEKFL